MMSKKRGFYSGKKSCLNGCIYCFANFSEKRNYLEAEQLTSDMNIIYPICDSEIGFQEGNYLDELIKFFDDAPGAFVVSISTKNFWADNDLEKIKEFNLRHSGKKTIKLSVSFSRKYQLEMFEPRALCYKERLALLKRITLYAIPTCVLIKPILPFVDMDEYHSLVRDCFEICRDFVIGPLYVDRRSKFYHDYVKNKFEAHLKWCEWLKCESYYVEADNYEMVKKHICSIGGHCYDSDQDFIDYILKTRGGDNG